MIFIHIILSIIFIYLGLNICYLLLFAIAGLFRRQKKYVPLQHKKRISILIPAYKEDSVIIDTATAAIGQNYETDCFDVTVIADQLKDETLHTLSQLPIRLLEVSFKNSTKAKSLKKFFTTFPDAQYDILMILDSDNIMGPGCLEKVNAAYQDGFNMIQLHRTAKNRNTPTAILDAASEEINNHIFRKGHRALGISSALIGSGMAFDFSMFKELMMQTDIENNPGEDREIYLEMLKKGEVCEYIEDALVFDEKVQSGQVLEKQRTRWISAQLQYAVRFWGKAFFKTLSFNIHYIDYALQTLLFPRILLLGTIFMLGIFNIVLYLSTGTGIYPGFAGWMVLLAGCIAGLGVSIYSYLSVKELITALSSLPKTFQAFIKALIKSRTNQKEFIHTPKEFSNISKP